MPHHFSEFAVKPHFGKSPVSHDRFEGNLQHFRSLFHGQTCKETQLDDTYPSRVDAGKCIQRIVQGNEVCCLRCSHRQIFVKPQRPRSRSSLEVATTSPKIHQNPPHQLSRDAEKVRAILPLHLLNIHQSR